MSRMPRWLAAFLRRDRHAHAPGGPECLDAPPPPPGLLVRLAGGVCSLLSLAAFALCLAAMLGCLVSLVAGLFTG
jgi:hypothetical protein